MMVRLALLAVLALLAPGVAWAQTQTARVNPYAIGRDCTDPTLTCMASSASLASEIGRAQAAEGASAAAAAAAQSTANAALPATQALTIGTVAGKARDAAAAIAAETAASSAAAAAQSTANAAATPSSVTSAVAAEMTRAQAAEATNASAAAAAQATANAITRVSLGAAASGANGDITALTGITAGITGTGGLSIDTLVVNRPAGLPAAYKGYVGGAFEAQQVFASASIFGGAANLTTFTCVATPANCSYIGASSSGMRYLDSTALADILSLNGGIGIVGGSHTAGGTSGASIGLAATNIADDTVTQRGGWGLYSSTIRLAGAGSMLNEIVVANAGASVPNNAYNLAPTGVTADLWLGSGGEYAQMGGTTNPISCTICVISENAIQSSLAGIVFAYNALSGDNGTTGTAIAIQMAKGHEVDWIYDSTGTRSFYMRSDGTAAGMGLVATQTDLKLLSSAAATLADFTSGGSLTLAGFVTGSRGFITPAGTTLAGATALTGQVNLLNSAVAGSGVTLPSVALGTQVWVSNGSTAAQNVYPTTSSGTINGGLPGAAISLANGASAIFTLMSSGSWFFH